MANQDELFDFNEEQKQLQKLIDQFKLLDTTIMKVSADALAAGRNINAITLPSDLANFTAQNAQLTATIQAQARELARLQAQYTTLTQQRQRSSQRTAEESVNQGILNRNAMEAARINSTLAGAYTRLSAEQSRASRLLQDLISRGRLATQTQREYDRELRIAQREFDTLNNRILAADRAVGRFNRNVGNYPTQAVRGLKDLLSAFGIVGGLQMFAQISKDIFETTKEIQSMDMALKQVTGTQELFNQSQMFLSRVSEAYGADLGKLTQQFTQFYVSAKDKISGNEIENIFESITKAGATMGLSTQQQERAFMALNQMMSKGTIQAEELRGQLGEALPGALGIMAKALGVTEKQLGQMMKDGELLASDVLPKFARQLEITYGIENVNRIDTLAAAQGRYTNAWRDFVRGLDEDGNKLSKFMKNAIGLGTDLLIGASYALESDQQTRNRTLKTLQESGFNQTMSYYKGLAELKKEDLENDKAYTLQKAKEETAEYKRLEQRNLILRAIASQEYGNNLDKNRQIVDAKYELKDNVAAMVLINNLLSRRKGQLSAVIKLLGDDNKATETNTELTEAQLKAIEDALKAKYDTAKKELELRALVQETILNGENESYENQYQALDKFLDLKMQIIKLDYNEQVRLAKGNKDKIRIAEIDAEMATIKQLQDGFNKTKAIRKKQNDEYIEEIKNVEKFLKDHEDEKTRIRETSDEFENDLFMTAWKAREEAYDKEIERLKELKQATSDYLSTFGDEFMSNSGFGETFNTFFKQIKGANGEMTTMFKQLMEGADTTAKKAAVVFTSIAESAQEMYNFISNASQANFDGEKERLQSQYDVAFEYANGNKEAEEKLANDLEAKKKEIANREAKAKKQQAIFNIAIDTAQAIIGLWAKPGFPAAIPMVALVAALGATQIAMVSSQKIPQYFKGGVHDGGLMMVNDAPGNNFKETIVFPNGGIAQPEGRNVLMNAPAGTKIHTPDQWDKLQQEKELFNMLQPSGIFMNSQQAQSGFDYDAMDDIMNKYLGNVTVEQTLMDKRGFRTFIKNSGSSTEVNRNFASSKGYKFK